MPTPAYAADTPLEMVSASNVLRLTGKVKVDVTTGGGATYGPIEYELVHCAAPPANGGAPPVYVRVYAVVE